MSNPAPSPRVIQNPEAPTIRADGIIKTEFSGNEFIITFGIDQSDTSAQGGERVLLVAGTLIVPGEVFTEMLNNVNSILSMRRHFVAPDSNKPN